MREQSTGAMMSADDYYSIRRVQVSTISDETGFESSSKKMWAVCHGFMSDMDGSIVTITHTRDAALTYWSRNCDISEYGLVHIQDN